MNRAIRYGLAAALLGGAGVYFTRLLAGHGDDLISWGKRVDPGVFLLAVSTLVLYHGIVAWFFKRWLMLLGGALSWSRLFRVIYASQMARFLPGGFWGYVGQVYLGSREGVGAGKMILASGAHTLLNVMTGLLLALWLLPKSGVSGLAWGAGPILWVGTAASVALLPRGMKFLHRRFSAAGDDGPGRLETSSLLGFSFLYGAHWLLYGVAFWIFLLSVHAVERLTFAKAFGALALAGVAGLVVPFVPGGLGVREGTLAFLLEPSLGPSEAAFVSLFSRVWLLIVDLICLGIALCLSPAGLRPQRS